MTKYLQKQPKNQYFITSRLVFETSGPSSSPSLDQQNNESIKDMTKVFKDALEQRLGLSTEIQKSSDSIKDEITNFNKLLLEMQQELPTLGNKPSERQFNALGETFKVVMDPNKSYSEYIKIFTKEGQEDWKSINFLEWALQKKKETPKMAE